MFITWGYVYRVALKFLDANELAMFALITNALPGFCKTFFAIVFDAWSPFLPKSLKKSPNYAASLMLSLTVIDFFRLHNERNNITKVVNVTLLPSEVLWPTMLVVAVRCLPPTQIELGFNFW